MEMKRCLLLSLALIVGGCASGTEAVDAGAPIDASINVVDANHTDGNPLIDASVALADAPVAVADAGSPLNIGARIVELYYDHTSGDDGAEWVKLYNGTPSSINLSTYALGWGGTDYTYGLTQLAGTVPAYGCAVIGGPLSTPTSGSPMFDFAVNFDPDMQNSGSAGDGVALFNVPSSSVLATTVPVHAVIYGPNNDNGLYDENGAGGDVDVAAAPSESSIRMKADQTWEINPTPTPNDCLPFPP